MCQGSVKGLKVIKNVKEIKFKRDVGRDGIKKIFPETITQKMRLTLVFMWNSAQRERSNFCFSKDSR